MTTTYSTLDALSTLCTSIPEWKDRLDELNGQIALRQIELARLEESEKGERPRTRSLKNKGSTESLRPKDGGENPFNSQTTDADNTATRSNPFESPRSQQNGFATSSRPSSSAAARAAAMGAPPAPKANSGPRPNPGALTRQSSQPTPPTQPRLGPAILRKRKTDSLASGESMAPKYRTRSMIIVYYDSAVQTAFEDLVKFVSGNRNAMRKGKMAAKMAEMRRAAELEVDADDDDDDDGLDDLLAPRSRDLLAAQKNVSLDKDGKTIVEGIGPVDSLSGQAADLPLPRLRFVSTRQMGPSRDYGIRNNAVAGQLSMGFLKGYRRGGNDGAPDIFDELDKGLEWCQSQCEHAAHQFLRDGECSTEIDNIKRKLTEVKESAERELEKLKKDEAASPPRTPIRGVNAEGKSRELKTVHMRREYTTKDLEVDDMEVDDEGIDDMDNPPQLLFKRSRDAHIH